MPDLAVSPENCHDMPALRTQIDALDRDLIALLKKRVTYIDRAVEIKAGAGLPANIPSRVEDVVAKVKAAAQEQQLDPELAEALWRHLIDWSIAREAKTIKLD
ncbi:chorismate mutase [Pelagimonas varians]|uniref:chorismate mutase n=1 Tax=Pelagimonas varians TaxID=696760 RepID=A0A238KSH8_9RHOB|nr:chorismate mutase [Pelagimonas varians]PYG28533.1 chorismate mutase [Pelagimonas varians]SMX45072.1 Salicylate biosynthesis protein PchB [Pelagimonas varians]